MREIEREKYRGGGVQVQADRKFKLTATHNLKYRRMSCSLQPEHVRIFRILAGVAILLHSGFEGCSLLMLIPRRCSEPSQLERIFPCPAEGSNNSLLLTPRGDKIPLAYQNPVEPEQELFLSKGSQTGAAGHSGVWRHASKRHNMHASD